MRRSLIALLASCLLFLGGCTKATPSPVSSDASAPLQSSSSPQEDRPAPLRGFPLPRCGLKLSIPENTILDPNRPELSQNRLCGLQIGSTQTWISDGFNGGFSVLYLSVGQSQCLTEEGVKREEYLYPNHPTRQWFYHGEHCYVLEANGGRAVMALQGFRQSDLAQPGAQILLGNRLMEAADLEDQVVFENEECRVYMCTEYYNDFLGISTDFPQEIRNLIRQRREDPLYCDTFTYIDPDYDYAWLEEALGLLLDHIPEYIAENPDSTAIFK